MEKNYTALGLMSGTSMDGVDASIIKSDGNREYSVKLDKYFEYGEKLRQKLIDIRAKILIADDLKASSEEIVELEREITLFHANAVNEILDTSKIEVDLIGFHGQTIFHDSKKKISKQLGDGKLLSQLTKKLVVYDFRQNDLKNGGQGAPLAPIFHNAMVNKYLNKELNKSYSVNILNIGGIANITETVKWEDFFRPHDKKIRASDISPGNCLIDEWVRKNSKNKFDKDGLFASNGKTDDLILNQALENFNIDPPYEESLDVNDFDISFVKGLTLENGASTLTDFTASLISKALTLFHSGPIAGEVWLVCGGGRKNKYLLKTIESFKKVVLHPSEKYGIDGDFVESQAFGYLAIRSFLKLPISFPTTTGCKEPTTGGVIVKNF
jgi:anhydro-N-acetylmuramic acid kinase